MAGEAESEGLYLRLPVFHGAVTGLVYAPEVDAVIISTIAGSILVYDASSFKLLFENKIGEGALSCLRHCHSSRLLVTDGARLGARSARGGIFHMPTILQTTATPEKEVVLDIPYGEASGLLENLRATTELGKWPSVKDSGKEQLLASLEEASSDEQARLPHHGTQTEWQFATIRGTPSLLRAALTATTPQARLLQIPICHELLARELVLDQEGDGEKICQMEAGKMGAEFLTSLPSSLNNMEALRKLSLVDWPLKNHRWATPSTLAAAGFHKSSKQDTVGWYGGGDNDLVTCFHCYKSLRSWEPCDEPWSEHTRHFPECSFVAGQRTANVPLSVTMATTPAVTLTHQHDDEPPFLSTSWGCPFVGVAWKNGTIAVYNVGKSFYIHQHCAPIQLSAEALAASLQFEETVNGVGGGVASCSPGGALEKALDGVKLAIANLQDMENTMTTDAVGPLRTSGSSLLVSACCVGQTPGTDRAPVAAAVVAGCSLELPGEKRALLVVYTLTGRKEGEGDLSYPAITSLTEIVPIPAVREIEGRSIFPTITDIVPCAGGRCLAVNVVYEDIGDEKEKGSSVQSEANDKGSMRDTVSRGTGPCNSSQNIVCSQTLLFEVGVETEGKGLSRSQRTSVSKSPVGSKVSHSPGTTFTKLTRLVEASDGSAKETIRLVGVSVDGRVQELVGGALDYGRVVVPGCDPVVLCAPCTGPDQLVVVRESSRMELVSLTWERLPTTVEGGEGMEGTDYSRGVETDESKETKRHDRVKSHFSFTSLKNIHAIMTGVGEEGLSFLSWAPPNWREIVIEQKDRGLPQHVHQPLKGEKEEFKKIWMIPWRTETVEPPLMVLEVTKPQQSSIAQLNVQLQSEVPESLIGLSVSVLAMKGPSRSREGSEGTAHEKECGSGVGVSVEAETVKAETGGASSSLADSATVEDLCRSSNAVCICGPVRCRDCLGIMQQEVTLALYHSSLWDSNIRKYLIVLAVSSGANVERATPTTTSKGKENIILSVAFLPSKVPIPLEEKSHLNFILLQPAFVQFLLVLAAGGRVLGEEFGCLSEEVQHWMQEQCVGDTGVQADGVRYSAVEVLCYIAGREVHQTDRCNCRVLLAAVSPVLGTLLYTCFLHGTRQLAYRTARFLRLCLRLALALSEGADGESVFSSALHCALVRSLPLLPSTSCAVGMRCFCDLLGAAQAPEELMDTVSGLLQVCGVLLDSVGSLSIIPALQGMAAAESSVINLNFDPYMFDGGLPSLLCLAADSGNSKPSLEYSSINHNNEMKLFCNGGTQVADQGTAAGKSFVTMLSFASGNGSKKYKELMCSSMKMAPFLRQPQAGALDSFEICYAVKSYSHCEPIQTGKQGAKDSQVPFPSLKSGNHLLKGVLHKKVPRCGQVGHRASSAGGTAIPLGMIEKIASKEPVDASTVRSQMACLEETLFSNFEVGGHKVEVASARSGQSFSAILDFRLPVRLTDVCIPTNPVLSSVSVDVWLTEGETPLRVLHAKDLSAKSVSLGNLSPSPLCQFAKVTFAVGTGKSSPSLVVDLGLYCGQLELPLLSPSVLHRLNQLTIQLQSHFVAVTEQLNTVLEYLVKAPPTAGDPVAVEMINLTKQMTRDAGSIQFTVSVLQSLWSRAISEHTERPHAMGTLGGTGKSLGGTSEPLGGAPETLGGAPETLGGSSKHSLEPQTGLQEYLIDPKIDTPGGMGLDLTDGCVPCNKWFSIARRLINKLTCLLARLKRANVPTPSSTFTRQQAKSMFYVLGLQCYAKVSARAMSVIVDNCAASPWWPELIRELVQEVTHDQRSLFYDKERAFALLSGFILHSSSPAIVDCLLCLLEERFSEQESQGATSFVHTQERIASYHWLLTVFCDAISSVIPAQRSDFLSMERCRRVSKGIVNLIIHLVASSNPSSGETVLIGCKAVLLLSKASYPALTLCDVFSEDSLVQYLTICCRSWGEGTGEGQSPSVWLTAVESVVLEIFEMECNSAEKVITDRGVAAEDNTPPRADRSSPSNTPRRDSPVELDPSYPTISNNPPYNSDIDSDEEFLGYLAKKAGIDPTSTYFAEDQYWPGKHLLQRYAIRKKRKMKESPPSNDTDDPPYSSYIVSGSVDHRLGASFELQAEKDMQVAWKEEYWNTLYFIAMCGPTSSPPCLSGAEGVPADDPLKVLAGLKASQALLSCVLVRLAGCCGEPFSELLPVALIRFWWGVTRLTLCSSDKEDPLKAVSTHFFLLELFSQFQASREQMGVDESKLAVDPAEVVSLSQLACQLGFLPHILQLIKDSPTEADGLLQGMKLVTTILAAQMNLSTRYGGTPPRDGSTSVDVEPLGAILESLFQRTVSLTQLDIVSNFARQLCKYYEEVPVMEEEEGSTKMLKCSGMLIVVERVAQFLRSTEPQQALQNRALVIVIDLLQDFFQRATLPLKETGEEEAVHHPGQVGEQESGMLRAIYSSQLLERFKNALKSLLELVLRTMLFYYGESGRDPVTMYTQDVAMRRYGDPSRNSWTEAHKSKALTAHGLMSMCGMMSHFVQWESNRGEDPVVSMWEELTKADSFIGMLLRVYLLCVKSKPETDTAQGSNALSHIRSLVLQIRASRLVQPIIDVLQWCGRGQAGLLPHFLELVECISSREGGKAFLELLLEQRALEAAVEGFLGSCRSHLPSEPSPLQLPYIWHLFKVNNNDELKNLSEFVLEPSHRVKLLLKGGRMRLAEGIQKAEPLVIRFKQPVVIHNIQLLNNMHSNGPRAVEVIVKAMQYSPEMSVTGLVQNPGGDSIKLELHSLPLVTELRITLWRAHSASAIYLSGLHIIGQPFQAVTHTRTANTAAPSNSWLSFLHWWLQQRHEGVQGRVEQTLAAQCAPLAQGCLQLLTVGANPAVLHFLVYLAGLSTGLSAALVGGLLRREQVGQFDPVLLLMGNISLEASMELLKLLCCPDTEPGLQRLERILQLMVELTQAPLDRSPHPLLIKCLASLVWHFPDKHIVSIQEADHTRNLADFAFRLPMSSPLKVAYNSLLCSLCAHPLSEPLLEELFEVAQKQFGVGNTSSSVGSIDDGFLSTLASLLQSHLVMEHFLRSKLANVVLVKLNQSLQELQTALSATSPWQQPATQHYLETARLLLMFVTGLAARMQLAKSWLGEKDATPIWTLLLSTAAATARLGDRAELKQVMDVTFEFFARCCEHHQANKALLALLLKNHVQSSTQQASGLSPLHHRLLNSIVLGVDHIPVVIQVENGNVNESTPPLSLPLLVSHHAPEYHPSLGAGNYEYISYLPPTMSVDSLLAAFNGSSGQPGTDKAAMRTASTTTATTAATPWDMYNLDFPGVMDHPDILPNPSPLQVISVPSPMVKKLPSRMKRRGNAVTKPPAVPGSTNYQLGLRPPGKSPLFVPLNCLTFGDLQQALYDADLAEDNPLALHLVYRASMQLQDLPDSSNMDAAVKKLANSLQQCFRKRTKPSNSHTQPFTEDAMPAPSLPYPLSGNIPRLLVETSLLEIVAAILPQLYGSLWPRMVGMVDVEQQEEANVTESIITAPPTEVPFHSVVMLGLGMGLSEVCLDLASDTSMDTLVMVKVVLGGSLSDVLAELNYTPVNKKKFACLPYQLVEQVLSKGGPDQEQAVSEKGPEQVLSKEGPEQATNKEGPEQAVSEKGPEQVLSKEGPEQATNKEGPEQAASEKGPEQVLSKEGPEQAASKEGPEQAASEKGPEQVLSKEGPEQALSKEGPEQVLNEEGLEQVLNEEGLEQVLSKEGPEQAMSKEGPEHVVTKEGPEQVLNEEKPELTISEGKLDEGLLEKVPDMEKPDQGLAERCFACGVLHHALGCIRHLGSHASRDKNKDATAPSSYIFQSTNDGGADLSAVGSGQKFFAKGTGFGSGSLRSGWDMKQVREAQKENEQQVECCLKIFAAFMNNVSPTSALWERQPCSLHDIVAWSALLPALASYLFNDSVLDMAQHVPLYLAVFAVVLSLSRQPRLVGLLLERPFPGKTKKRASSIFSLMERMKSTAEQYQKAARLATQRLPKPVEPVPSPNSANEAEAQPSTEDNDATPLPIPSAPPLLTAADPSPPLLPKGLGLKKKVLKTRTNAEKEDDGVLQLVHAIESTWAVLQERVAILRSQWSWENDHDEAEDSTQKTSSEVYMETMRPLQFDSSEMTSVGEDGKISCLVPYHYAGYLESAVEPVGGARAMRITQEITTLANSLPLSASSSVFIRCDEERLDVMKVLITGPADTPYANGCYVFDVFFPSEYPNRPMLVNLQTTGHGTVRFNPNLYADGKVCLSVLNTWSGRPEEKWNPTTSSMLQVLVSIQSLILVAEPYFNEPGYERQRGTPQGNDQNLVYNAVVSSENVRWAILEQIINPSEPFREVILQHFYLKQHEVLRQCREWRRLFADALEKKKHLATVAAKLKVLDSLLPQLERKLAELKADQLQPSPGT